MTSASVDKAEVDEEMDEAVEARLDDDADDGLAVDNVTDGAGGKGCEMDRFNPSRSALTGVWLTVAVVAAVPLPLAALAACRDRNEPGLLHDGTSSSVSITCPDCVGDEAKVSTSVAGGGGGREGGPLCVCQDKINRIKCQRNQINTAGSFLPLETCYPSLSLGRKR